MPFRFPFSPKTELRLKRSTLGIGGSSSSIPIIHVVNNLEVAPLVLSARSETIVPGRTDVAVELLVKMNGKNMARHILGSSEGLVAQHAHVAGLVLVAGGVRIGFGCSLRLSIGSGRGRGVVAWAAG